MSFTSAWDESKPAGSRNLNLGDDDIREFKQQVRERNDIDGYWPSTDDANTGYRRKSTFLAQASDPAQVAGTLILYGKTTGGYAELFSRHENAALQQLTLNGKLWISALSIASIAQGDLFYYDGTIVNRLAKGTALQKLRINAGATAPEWADDLVVATQAEMETATAVDKTVTPGRVQYNPGVAKAWCFFDGSTAGTFSPTVGNNVASITRNGTGDYTVTFTTAFSSANYVLAGSADDQAGSSMGVVSIRTLAAGSARITVYDGTGTLRDKTKIAVIFHGDQ